MEVDETKQWIVSRVDAKHANYLEELSVIEERFAHISEAISKFVKNGRNYTFSLIGGALTVLLTLLSVNILNPLTFYFSLALLVLCTVMTFSITNRVSNRITDPFNLLSGLCITGQEKISFSRNYFTGLTVNLDNHNKDDLEKYSSFVEILLTATLIPMFITYSQFHTLKWMPKDQAEAIKMNLQSLKNQIDSAQTISLNLSSPILPIELVNFTKSAFVEYDKFQKS